MGLFGKRQSQLSGIVSTPQSLVRDSAYVGPSALAPDDPDDALRFKLLVSVQASLAEMMSKYSECFEKAEFVDKAFGVANAEFFNGVQQHEISRANFRGLAVESERELGVLLGDLREANIEAQRHWGDLLFLLPGSEGDVMKIGKWCMSHDIDAAVMSYVLTNGMFLRADYGLTRESFWTENDRVVALMKNARS